MAEPQLPLPMMQTLFFIDDLLIIVTQISRTYPVLVPSLSSGRAGTASGALLPLLTAVSRAAFRTIFRRFAALRLPPFVF